MKGFNAGQVITVELIKSPALVLYAGGGVIISDAARNCKNWQKSAKYRLLPP